MGDNGAIQGLVGLGMAKELFWPGEGDGDALSLARKRAIIVFCLAGGGLGFISSVRGYLAGELLPGTANFHLSIFGPLVILFAPLLIRLRFDPEKIITAILAYSYVLIAAISVSDGGIVNHSQFFLVAWAAIVALLYGWKGAFTSGVLTLISFAALLSFNQYVTPSAMGLMESEALLREWLVTGLAFCLLLVISSAAVFQTSMHRAAKRLNEATQAAQAAERAKSEFLANMSHEIRTPMNGVMGMAELLASTELDAKQRMFTDVIVKSGASLLTIINDILDFSKIDAGLMHLDPEPFALAEAIEDVATLVSTRAAEKDVELIVRVDPALPEMVVGDVGRIRQVLTNLVGNAVKFTDQGHVYVDVNGEIVDDGNGGRVAALNVRVEDTGIGIAPDKLAKAFDKFSQVDSSATRKHEGTGLGLAIASSLIDLMGGEIGAESEEGVGSTFWFKVRLPVHGAAERKKRVPVDVTGANVVIIDDNKVNRAILGEQMRAWRFESADCQSGEEGLALLRAAHAAGVGVDAVILDFQMPGMSGEEVLREIRNDPALSGLAVIMLTSVDYAKSHPSVADLVLQAVLTKPTRSSLLLETIVDVISQRRSNGEMVAMDAIEALRGKAGDLASPRDGGNGCDRGSAWKSR